MGNPTPPSLPHPSSSQLAQASTRGAQGEPIPSPRGSDMVEGGRVFSPNFPPICRQLSLHPPLYQTPLYLVIYEVDFVMNPPLPPPW